MVLTIQSRERKKIKVKKKKPTAVHTASTMVIFAAANFVNRVNRCWYCIRGLDLNWAITAMIAKSRATQIMEDLWRDFLVPFSLVKSSHRDPYLGWSLNADRWRLTLCLCSFHNLPQNYFFQWWRKHIGVIPACLSLYFYPLWLRENLDRGSGAGRGLNPPSQVSKSWSKFHLAKEKDAERSKPRTASLHPTAWLLLWAAIQNHCNHGEVCALSQTWVQGLAWCKGII